MVCHENRTILMKHHSLFVIFEKAATFEIVIGGSLRVNCVITVVLRPLLTEFIFTFQHI